LYSTALYSTALFGFSLLVWTSKQALEYTGSDYDAENDHHRTRDLVKNMNVFLPQYPRTCHEKAIDRALALQATTDQQVESCQYYEYSRDNVRHRGFD
jgi:hypothetical protein